MDSIEQTILEYILEQWHKTFAGVSALSVADHFGIPHEQVLGIFDELEELGKGHIRRDVTLYRISISLENPKFETGKEINTTIFFPAKELLKEDVFAKELDRADIPEYEMRLHKGDSQVQHVYFNSEVLRKYLDHIEIYDVENTVVGGNIRLSSKYLSTLNPEQLDEIEFGLFLFGKRMLSDGNVAITAIVHDLAELPVAEQRYWHSYEFEEPEFSSQDPDYEVYYGRSIEGEFLDDNDPLRQALSEISEINILLEKSLYSLEVNPDLSYPVVNTYKKFCDSCSELYKLVGPDNLVENTIKELLLVYFGYSQTDFIHKESGRPIGKLALFKQLCKKANVSDFAELIDEIQKYRVSADHKIMVPHLPEQNYITEFRSIAQHLYDNLSALRIELEKLKSATKS